MGAGGDVPEPLMCRSCARWSARMGAIMTGSVCIATGARAAAAAVPCATVRAADRIAIFLDDVDD